MIDPKILTPEFGFEDGVVVEYQYHSWGKIENEVMTFHGFFGGVDRGRVVIRDWECDHATVECELIESIRPLTGPMAIWNFAPEWAQWLLIWDGEPLWKREYQSHTSGINRPWWATKNEQGDVSE